MSIKFRHGLVFAVAMFAASCANENQPYHNIPRVQLKGGDCLKGATGTVDRYVKGQAKASDVEGFWSCVDYAVRTFRDKVSGNDPRGYTPQEIRDFLQRYFLGGDDKDAVQIDNELLIEFMEVKRLLVGGTSDFITRAELEKGVRLFLDFKTITVGLMPHVNLLFYQNNGSLPTNQEVDEAATQIIGAFNRLGAIIEKNNVGYDFARLEALLTRLNDLFAKHEKSDTFGGVSRMVPLFAKIKGILLNSSVARIGGNEWQVTCDAVGRAFALYLRGYFFLSEKSLFDNSRLDQFEKMARMAVSLLTESFTRRGNSPIRLEETDSVIDSFAEMSDMPFGLTVEQFKSMWRTVVDKVLSGAAKDIPGLALAEVQRLDVEFSDWLTIQRWLLGGTGAQPKGDSIDEIQKVLATPWPLSMDMEGRLVFTPDRNAQWNVESMSRMNWLRAVFRLVLLAYTQDDTRRRTLVGLDKTEFATAYQDLKPFLVALGLIEESNTTFGDRVIREAGLFTSRGNGDAYLNFVEMIEYVHYILSGIDAGELFVQAVQGDCPVVNDAIQASCFRVGFRKYFADRYAHLPLMVSYSTAMNDKAWANMLKALEQANRDEGNADTPVKTSDIYEMGILLQYIETIMLRFDSDLNGTINLQEGLNALPLFQNILAEFMGMDPKKDIKDIRAVFTYMLKYGEPPNPKKPLSLLRYLYWRWNEKTWKVDADRGVLLQILSALSSL